MTSYLTLLTSPAQTNLGRDAPNSPPKLPLPFDHHHPI